MNEIKYKSGVEGLDCLLHNGFVLPKSKDGLVLLIKGKPGTGKSTLALKIASNVAKEMSSKGIREGLMQSEYQDWSYFSFEQKEIDIREKAKKFRCDLDANAHIMDNTSTAANAEDTTHCLSQTALMWAQNIMYNNFISKEQYQKIIVIDGLNLMDSDERSSINMNWLISSLRKYSLFSIIVYEPMDGEGSQIDSMVDMIFQLKGEEFFGPPLYYLNKICIPKSRYQNCVLGWHQYKIIDSVGIVIYPSIHNYIRKGSFFKVEADVAVKSWYEYYNEYIKPQEEEVSNKQYISSESILAKLLDNHLYTGSFTVLLGPRKTCKTLLTINFLKDGSDKGKKGLIVSLIDNRETIIKNAVRSNDDSEISESQTMNNYLFHFRPGCITSNEFFYYLDQQVKDRDLERFVFWDLPQIDHSYPFLSNDNMFFPALIDYMKNNEHNKKAESDQKKAENTPENAKCSSYGRSEIASVVIGTFYCKLAKSAFTMADNVILLLRGTYREESTQSEYECIYAYVDRIEGKPGYDKLFMIPLTASKFGGSNLGNPVDIGDRKHPILNDFKDIIDNIERME